MKEIIYPQKLKETVVSKGDLSYIRTSHVGATPPPGPITCIPSNYIFTDDLMNFDLVSTVDVRYQFYTIIETSDGKRFFMRIEDNAIPLESVTMDIYDDNDQLVPMGITAATVFTETMDNPSNSLSGFNEPFNGIYNDIEYIQFVQGLMFRYNVELIEIPRVEGLYRTVISNMSGLTQDSRIPDILNEIGEMVDLRLYKDSYTFKFARATLEDVQRYGIVNNGSQRCINIIDYINGGNEIVLQSCAQVDLPTDPIPDSVSSISCVDAPFEYTFSIQNMYNLPDVSGTLQITDSITGKSKKYIFNDISQFMSFDITNFIHITFPAYDARIRSDEGGEFIIIKASIPAELPERYFHPLKIIIQMNSPNALFDTSGTNRLAFCLSVESITGDGTPPPPPTPEPEPTPSDPPPVINCIPTSFNITQIQGDATKEGNVIVVASIWYEGVEYPYITTREQMRYVIANVDGSKVGLASGFNTGINIYDKVYNRYPEFCKAIVLARDRTDNFFIAGASMGNLDKYALTPRIWDMRPYEQSFKRDTMRPVEAPSQLRLTKLSPEMQQFIKDNHEYGIFFNGNYNVNNLVDMVNQGNDIIIKACVKVESNMFDEQPELPPVVTTPPKPAMAIVNMISDTPFISTFKNGFELESYYDAEAGGYHIENENNKIYLRDPAYAPVVSFRPKQGNLMGATQIQGEVYDWKGIGFDISLATTKHLNKIQNIYGFPSNDVVLVMLSQLNEEQSAPPILNGRFVCNPEIE